MKSFLLKISSGLNTKYKADLVDSLQIGSISDFGERRGSQYLSEFFGIRSSPPEL